MRSQMKKQQTDGEIKGFASYHGLVIHEDDKVTYRSHTITPIDLNEMADTLEELAEWLEEDAEKTN
jgi:hypothetical protein